MKSFYPQSGYEYVINIIEYEEQRRPQQPPKVQFRLIILSIKTVEFIISNNPQIMKTCLTCLQLDCGLLNCI